MAFRLVLLDVLTRQSIILNIKTLKGIQHLKLKANLSFGLYLDRIPRLTVQADKSFSDSEAH